ncbi:hypothetical protein GCM10023229_27220 [Flavisolibacter ginsenosidimutans]
MLYNGYNVASQTVSELSAVGAPTKTVWVILGSVYTLLFLCFGWAVRIAAAENKHLRKAGNLLLLNGIVSLFWPLAPMHRREILAAGGATISDTMHLVLAALTVALMFLAVWFAAKTLGKRFRVYCYATLVVFAVFGMLTGIDAPKISVNAPTPFTGVWERINIGAFMLWMMVLAALLWRREDAKIHNENKNRRRGQTKLVTSRKALRR